MFTAWLLTLHLVLGSQIPHLSPQQAVEGALRLLYFPDQRACEQAGAALGQRWPQDGWDGQSSHVLIGRCLKTTFGFAEAPKFLRTDPRFWPSLEYYDVLQDG